MAQKIVCFGETLWDMLPSGRLPGGAPMNVAIHLTYNQFTPVIISRLGSDDLGKDLLNFLADKNIPTDFIQIGQTHLTGVVKANISDKNEVTYKIVEPVAWDYIQYDSNAADLIRRSDVFVYGSLTARSSTSENTLLQYLPLANLKVFDVNFRPPHYTPDRTQVLMQYADIIKMNHQELAEISSWFSQNGTEQEQMTFIKSRFDLKALVVTRGDKGAAVLTDQGYAEHPGFTVEVEDTIGSGDAFLATFLSNYLQQLPMPVCLENACKIGAYVATQKGATPTYDPRQVMGAALEKTN